MNFDSLALEAGLSFGRLADVARRDAASVGGRFVSRVVLEDCRRSAVADAVRALNDADLLACVASRPGILDHDERLTGGSGSLRGAMRGALSLNLSDHLEGEMERRLVEGQDMESLPEAVDAALAALGSSRTAYPLMETAEDVLREGCWDDCARALAAHAANFLVENGHVGAGGDLMAAVDARESVEEAAAMPTSRLA